MIQVGILGCGKMAEQHAAQIKRISGAEIMAVCDTESLMAKQLAERFGIKLYFADVLEMLYNTHLDVVHITTPPHSHFKLGKICLNAGCHVYMEKPFTLNTKEADELFTRANKKGVKIIAGHNAQFTHAMLRMRELVNQDYLGGNPVHMECYYCYEFANETYAKAFLGDANHWVRSLPGSLLQNIISHGISKIAEFLMDDEPLVIAHGFTSPFLQRIGELDIIDEVRVIIKAKDSTTAYFTFSSQISPAPHSFKLYGPKRTLTVDDDYQTVIKLDNKEYKSYLRYFIPPRQMARQYRRNARQNISQFLKRDFHLPNDAGLKRLIEAFYSSIVHNTPLPISQREIRLTSRIMDEIFMQIKSSDKQLLFPLNLHQNVPQ